MRLLCISNGHGEDQIGARILEALQKLAPEIETTALPIVGLGTAYQNLGIAIAGPVEVMPSGGFIYQDGRQLWRDLRAGLLGLLGKQVRAIQAWESENQSLKTRGIILAVGDIVPLGLAGLSRSDYGFVGTAKSEYYIRDETGKLLSHRWGLGWAGSDYLPWEQWLMARPGCVAVFARDELTHQVLTGLGIRSFNCGNPMMDELPSPAAPRESYPQALTITLLPGSRPPEAYQNWQRILAAIQQFPSYQPNCLFLAAISPGLELAEILNPLVSFGWKKIARPAWLKIGDSAALTFQQNQGYLVLTQQAYSDCLHLGDLAIAQAGTATEQCVGLGKPVITFPGQGPQFTPLFARCQARLLGISVHLVENPTAVMPKIIELRNDHPRLDLIRQNGQQRMGQPGAAQNIANRICQLLNPNRDGI
ncbi:lipid-A-disaccharide synthase-related protein [Synechococcus sp. PCC 6312]|uniref:lipid-A-disaccharide synthase-related protein n=1 Tax=Synechococcus sp. (strain ATCC 27167 / PCC 6312) TaxID=195253 RepID=UPI00029EDEA5|nr:lipid-A-disaccharide synthase-related protein [Synechococcus sp. PCC 6312]AFY62313.1 hypothetical protein Syn6312_3269 [Synechococcus sp. PCC 6312]